MTLTRLTPDEWAIISEQAHLVTFGTHRPATMDRVDFVLAMEDRDGPIGYVTCREQDAKTLYWQFGGAFPNAINSIRAFRGTQAFARWSKDRYHRVTACIANDNTPMLKMASKLGFKIVGLKIVQTKVLLEHLLDFTEGDHGTT